MGLIHISGSTIEVKQKGEYDIAELAQKFSTDQTSFTGKYADYVVSRMTSADADSKNYNYTGAVKRDIASSKEIILWAPSESNEQAVNLLQTVPVQLNWGKVEGITSYVIRITSFDDSKVFYSQRTGKNSLTLDLSKIAPTTENIPYFITVSAQGGSENAIQSKKPFYLLDNQSSETVTFDLNRVKEKVDEESAIGNLIIASFYEENGFTMYAISSYQKAVLLEPEVTEYKEIRNIYFNNHQVLFAE